MPETFLKKLNHRIAPQWKVCFFSALVVGLLAHFYKLTNWLPNWDSLVFRYDSQNMLGLGRWFLPVVCSFSSFYDLPFLSGLLAILFHGMGSVYICRMFHVRKKITAGLIGAVVVSFPVVTSVMMYNYVADGYSIAFFLSVLAAFYLTKEKPNYLLSTLFITLSAGIYQAYVTVTVMLLLMYLIDAIIFQKVAFRWVAKQGGCMLLSGIAGMAIYAVVLKVLLGAFSVELLDYQGMSDTASFSGIDLLASLYVAKETFRKCFFDGSGGVNVYVAGNVFVFLFTLVSYIAHCIKQRVYQNPATAVLLPILGVMLILGAGALAFVNPGVDYHNLMRMGYVVFYLFFLLLYERGEKTSTSRTAIRCWIVCLSGLVILANQIVISNVSYHKGQIAYEKSYGVLVRIADRVEQTPGNETCNKLLVIGALDNSEAYSVNLTPDITGITDGYILRADDETVGQSVLCSALNDYCGKNYTFVSGEEKEKMLQKETIQSMGIWPSKDCVAVVEDTIVLKLGT